MGATIGTVLLTFKTHSRYKDLIAEMEKKGYMDRWGELPNKVYILPACTLWHNYKSTDCALADLKNACTTLQILIENAVAVYATEFVGL